MPKLSGSAALALCLLIAHVATAGEVEEMDGAQARDRIAASRGLVLVDLYAEW